MNSFARQTAGWVAAVGLIGVLAVALAMRGGTTPVGGQEATASASDPEAAAELATPQPTRLPTTKPTAAVTPSPTTSPATASPVPATAQPTPVAVAPAPASPTPVPVHDDEPVLATNERVNGTLGQTLTIDGYQVRVVRKTATSVSQCATIHDWGEHIYEVTITYSGPLFEVQHMIGGWVSMACIEGEGDARQQFPSGTAVDVFIEPGEQSPASGSPVEVWITTVNGPHSLTFAFH